MTNQNRCVLKVYPQDIHAPAFSPGTSLVARDGEQPIGFLFGFVAFGGPGLPAAWARHHGEVSEPYFDAL